MYSFFLRPGKPQVDFRTPVPTRCKVIRGLIGKDSYDMLPSNCVCACATKSPSGLSWAVAVGDTGETGERSATAARFDMLMPDLDAANVAVNIGAADEFNAGDAKCDDVESRVLCRWLFEPPERVVLSCSDSSSSGIEARRMFFPKLIR